MKITNFRRVADGPVVARFDWEVSPDLKMLNWFLKRRPTGELAAYPPNLRHGLGSAAAVTSSLLGQVSESATEHFNANGGRAPRDQFKAA